MKGTKKWRLGGWLTDIYPSWWTSPNPKRKKELSKKKEEGCERGEKFPSHPPPPPPLNDHFKRSLLLLLLFWTLGSPLSASHLLFPFFRPTAALCFHSTFSNGSEDRVISYRRKKGSSFPSYNFYFSLFPPC